MKNLQIVIFSSVMVSLLSSCASTDLASKYPNMIADVDPFAIGTIEASFDRFFSSNLANANVEVIFYPRENTVALSFKYQTINYRQFWDKSSREIFAGALEQYKADYSERKLINKFRKTRAVYGKAKGSLEWETFKFTKTHVSKPTIELGYRIKNEKPFFTTLMRSAREEQESGDSNDLMDNQQVNMYFTRAQADELAKLFDQEFLLETVNSPQQKEEAPAETPQDSDKKTRNTDHIEYED